MPIRAENKARYPADWPQISASIRERAGNKCEECGVANRALGGRADDGTFLPADPTGDNGLRFTWPTPGEHWWCSMPGGRREWLRIIRIVLTVAHLNHKPEDCRPENLRCWCQRCHNRYDAAARRRGIQERAKAKAAVGDLFGS
ncbi:hypothetical protein [Afipia felis]|uniref:HNH endonuclease n=2 Tax=Afipia felis TaxID=1035 RepID=A0A380W5J5_AFIFE|nr:hypothetical protein [Afipia felis]EKS26509.1 hypothetical protein HMPREF9697_04035 [Afipia felis ATCC 53690]SUU76157.1 Uncharacterised protein [Afipia felis]SUU84224.1 Uncharacterised protein [Afipia felis]